MKIEIKKLSKQASAILGTILLTVISSPAHAQCTVPYVLTNGEVADATEVMENFDAIAACTDETVSATGTPQTGSIAVFTAEGSIGSGNLSGDVTTSGGTVTTLAPTGVTAGSYSVADITVDAKGRIVAFGVYGFPASTAGTGMIARMAWAGLTRPC